MRFRDRVSIVAGGGGGIGRGIATALGDEGSQVIIWGLSDTGGKNTEKQIRDRGGKALAMKVDVLDYHETRQGVNNVLKQFGKVDFLVTTVGGGIFKPFIEYTPEFWQKQLDYNVNSTFNCCRAVIEPMVSRNFGRIVVLLSTTGGTANLAAYGAGKAACKGLVETIAVEHARNNITINCLTPGIVLTPLTRRAYGDLPDGDKILDQTLKQLPWGANTPENVAAVSLFLLSDDAARITGQVFRSM